MSRAGAVWRGSAARVSAVMAAGVLLLAACTGSGPEVSASVDTTDGATAPITASGEAAVADDAASIEPVDDPASTLLTFYDAPNQSETALQQLKDQGRDADAALIERIASQPIATWLGEWSGDVTATVSGVTSAAAEADQIALFVVYNIPGRDCGLYSAGGMAEDEYLAWVGDVTDGIADGARTWVILEPDALAQLGDCDGQGDRAALLAGAAEVLDDAGADVFLDVGHSGWNSAVETAARMQEVGTLHLAGFATNTSNYNATSDEQVWADDVAAIVNLPYVIDTSRNGNGSNGEWCNPRGRALGENPGLTGEMSGLIARVWVKAPGESDGTCNGGPAAGQWWEDIALELARNAA